MKDELRTEHVGIRTFPSVKKDAVIAAAQKGSTLSMEIEAFLKRLGKKAVK